MNYTLLLLSVLLLPVNRPVLFPPARLAPLPFRKVAFAPLPDSLRWPYRPLRLNEILVLESVLFQLRTAELIPESTPTLKLLVAELLSRPTLRIQLAGHTDRIGRSKDNMKLSEQRAEAIRAYLIRGGVAAARLITVGYGDARPLYPTPDERNRRVEVRVVE
ncbi:OmpA family protein [Hymenobacter terrestris]|uniref:OmpA family protein n=1 Tax=Hymenobacter terrestris TaxID=2748310 RepID=A0ABX2Q1P7_9BACT|nr:OmpA family protein [Hymenobacter terrestris]NVO84225.1 OmpA family protein [Hymenobacter terrestris]